MHIITVLREYLGINQVTLAKQANITQADLSEMESRPPYGSIEKYRRLAAVLDVPVHTLVTNDFTTVPLSFFDTHPHRPYCKCKEGARSKIGRNGEDEALRMEQERVTRISPTLSHLVLPYYKLRTHSPGYDILSFDENAKPIFIEVKTTEGPSDTDFTLTSREHDTAKKVTQLGKSYLIYRFSNWGQPNQQLDVLDFATMSPLQIYPSNYTCSMTPRSTDICGITYHRQQRNLTQTQLAEMLNILQNHLCLYEKGVRSCPVTIYQKISELLEVPIDDLLKTYPVHSGSQ